MVPDTSKIRITFQSRDSYVSLTADNRGYNVPSSAVLDVEGVPEVLQRVELGGSSFIEALRSRLMWGGDVRNVKDRYE